METLYLIIFPHSFGWVVLLDPGAAFSQGQYVIMVLIEVRQGILTYWLYGTSRDIRSH